MNMIHPHFMLIQYRDINIPKCCYFKQSVSQFECCAMADNEDIADFFCKMLPSKVSEANRLFRTRTPLVLNVDNNTATVSYNDFDFIRFSALPITGLYKANTSDGSFIGLLMDYLSMTRDTIINGKTLKS